MDQNGRDSSRAEVVVVGGGPAGLTAAVALAQAGVETVLVAKRPAARDNRTSALLSGSVAALDAIGVWELCRDESAPLRIMRIVDDMGRLLRAPEVRFDAAEIDLDAFGHNIENRHLVAALERRAAALPSLSCLDDEAVELVPGDAGMTLTTRTGRIVRACLVIGADGRDSLCRRAAGIEVDRHAYRQTALTFNLRHTHPHHDTSTEFHTPEGPFTLVPLPGQHSSLVWVCDPATARRMQSLGTDLPAEIERRSHSILGKIEIDAGPGCFPLAAQTARRFAGASVALIGEAAHVIPPIGAQGLNLGLRDAATIAELAVAAARRGEDPGSADLLARYDAMRRADVRSRTVAIDLLNRSLLTGFLPIHGLRGLGLFLLDRVGPLRRAVMREGVMPAAAQPRLMRGEAL